ncbi:MAG: DNA alkylation repair protein [Clostridiales bacterium]|nr:DNA alkylation repair protein [Clostridiales bacterium]
MTRMQELLFEHQDIKYADFQANLTPGLSREQFIGVRTPVLRDLAKRMAGPCAFMEELPHFYFEENQLHAFLIAEQRDYALCLEQLEVFLPYIDNWATCDQLSPKVFKKDTKQLLPYIDRWLDSSHIYTVRFGIGMLMRYFLDTDFEVKYAERVAAIPADRPYFRSKGQRKAYIENITAGQALEEEFISNAAVDFTDLTTERSTDQAMEKPASQRPRCKHTEHQACCDAGIGVFDPRGIYTSFRSALSERPYYISMMIAWYFATALAKQYEAVLPFIEERRLDPWTHNKTIQKALESYRILPEQKEYLRTQRIRTQRSFANAKNSKEKLLLT